MAQPDRVLMSAYIKDVANRFCFISDNEYLERSRSGSLVENAWQMSPAICELYAKQLLMQYYCEYWGAWQYANAVMLAPEGAARNVFSKIVREEYGHALLVAGGDLARDIVGPLGVLHVNPAHPSFRADSPQGQFPILRIFQHNGFKRWSEIVVYNHLQDRSAALQLRDFASGAFLPWSRVLEIIDAEENFHIKHGERWFDKIAATSEGRRILQEDIDKWYPHAMDVFGHPGGTSRTEERLLKFGIKKKTNDQIRKEFGDEIMPLILKHNLGVPEWTYRPNRPFA